MICDVIADFIEYYETLRMVNAKSIRIIFAGCYWNRKLYKIRAASEIYLLKKLHQEIK